jgi:uncharacterized membrane protein
VRDRSRALLHRLFRIGVVFKGIDGVLELAGGVLFAAMSPHRVHAVVRALTQHELSEDPHDVVAHAALRLSGHLSTHTRWFGAVYLVAHGVIKLALVVGLWLGRHWVYPTAVGIFGLFLLYQLYRYALNGSLFLLVLSGLDVVVIGLTWMEFQRVRRGGAE